MLGALRSDRSHDRNAVGRLVRVRVRVRARARVRVRVWVRGFKVRVRDRV